ncbi:MAG TPA: asparagine synthase-related protein [Anaerohalosphaeraceae bacterium]|nr:asparagine synthase-related protein [Anaerohalosphaeraceae bacterium]
MSLIAGCFCLKEQPKGEVCFEKIKAYSLLLKDSGRPYELIYEKTPQAVLLAKYRQTQPPQLFFGQTQDLLILTLGYHDLSYPPAWAEGLTLEQAAERVQNSQGQFVTILADRRQAQIKIVNNRYATRAFYYLFDGRTLWFASNITFLMHLCGQKARPDPIGILQIACYGHTLSPRTHTQGVRRLFPATCLSASPEGIQEKTYWHLGYEVSEGLEPDSYADEVFEAFEKSVARTMARSLSGFISLSGGMDSRMVAGAAVRYGKWPAFTFSNNTDTLETPDVKVARQVCQRLELEHHVVQMTAEEAFEEADEIVRLCGGLLPFHHPLKGWQKVKWMCRTTGYNIGGGCGDPIAGDYVNSIYQIEPVWTDGLLRLYAQRRRLFAKNELKEIFRSEVLEEAFGPMEEEMVESLRGRRGPTAAHKIAAWSQVYFNAGFTFCGPASTHPDVSGDSPHLGYEYVEKMLRLPADWLYKKNFYHYMITRCLPTLRDIIYANTGQLLSGRMETYRLPWRKKAARAVWQRLPFALTAKLWHHPVSLRPSTVGVFEKDARLHKKMNEILEANAAVREVFEPDGCRRFIAEYAAGQDRFGRSSIGDELFGTLVSLFCWFHHTSS